jgi:hypothetical protein
MRRLTGASRERTALLRLSVSRTATFLAQVVQPLPEMLNRRLQVDPGLTLLRQLLAQSPDFLRLVVE